jgi:hypothetical protein
MHYTTKPEFFNEREIDVDFWLCLFCGYEVITPDQIQINDARWMNMDKEGKVKTK